MHPYPIAGKAFMAAVPKGYQPPKVEVEKPANFASIRGRQHIRLDLERFGELVHLVE